MQILLNHLQELAHEIAHFGNQKEARLAAATAKLKAAKKSVEAGRAAVKKAATAHTVRQFMPPL